MSHTIFLVEDDPALRGELAALLERYGYVCASTDDYEDVAGTDLVQRGPPGPGWI